jgi:hypothetical protein
MARAYFYVVDQGPNWTIRYESRNYGMFVSEEAAYSQATQWARNQGKDGHDGQVFTRAGNGKYSVRWSFAHDVYPAAELHPSPQDGIVDTPVMLPQLLAALMVALFLASPHASAEDTASGTVEICRQEGIVDVYTGKPIGIPAGATFADNGSSRNPPVGDSAHPFRIATIEAAQIAAKASCAVVRARITQNIAGAGVRAADGRRLSPARAASGDLTGWPGNLYLFARIASDFQ